MTLKEQFARARHPLLFLALLIQPVGGQLAAAQEKPTPDYALIIGVYSGAVAPDATQEKGFWLWLESLKRGEESGGAWLPKVIHTDMRCQRKISILPSRVMRMDRRSLSRVMSAGKWTAT